MPLEDCCESLYAVHSENAEQMFLWPSSGTCFKSRLSKEQVTE